MQKLNRIALCSLLALLSGAGCSSDPARPAAAKQHNPAASTPADVLLADAMRRHNQDRAQTLALVRAAAEKAPKRTDVSWLYSQLCAQTPSCQPQSAEAHLRRLDPGNGAAWLGALARARAERDVAAENEILEAMSRSQRFDIYWNSLVSRMAVVTSADTAARMGPTVPDLITSNLNDVIGWLSSIATPAFGPLGESCSATRVSNPAIAQRCRAISTVLIKGDSFIAESVGLGIAERLAPPGSPQGAAVAQQIKRARYQRDTAGQIINGQLERDKFSRELIKLMATQKREQDVFLTVIRWAGQPVEPAG